MIFASIIHFGSGIIKFFLRKFDSFLLCHLLWASRNGCVTCLSVTQWYAEKRQTFGKKHRTTTCKSCFLFVKRSELDMNVFVLTSYCLNAKFCLDPHNFSSFFQVNRLEYKPQWPASGRDFCVIAILREIDEGVIALASEAVCALSVIFLRFIS